MKKKLIIFALLIGLFCTIIIAFWGKDKFTQFITSQIKNHTTSTIDNMLSTDEEEIQYETFSTDNLNSVKQTGWIPYWGFDAGLKEIITSNQSFYSIAPVLYEVSESGQIENKVPWNYYELYNYSQEKNILIFASIASFKEQEIKNLVISEENINNNIDYIISQSIYYGFDGIDLDFEAIETEDQENFYYFLNNLKNKLHENGLLLSITVYPQWVDVSNSTSTGILNQTRKVQDWKIIFNYADEIRIMTYEYSGRGSVNPGPIAPLTWCEDVIKYALKTIPREKIWLGIHLYGYEWKDRTYNQDSFYTKPQYTSTAYASAINYENIQTKISISDVKLVYLEDLGENIAEYPCDDTTCVLVYNDDVSIEARKKLSAKYGLAGVSYWRIGNNGDLL